MILSVLLEPGFFSNGPVRVALVVGALVAVSTSAVGVFAVLRSQGFAGHALTDVATAGGAGAYVIGWPALAGLLGGALLGAGAIEVLGAERARRRDLATGVVLGAALGLAALFFYLAATTASAGGAAQEVLFGSIFTVPATTQAVAAILGAACVAGVAVLRRPLLLSSLSPELARARGIPVRAVSIAFSALLAVSVALAAVALGSILATALLIGPAATAARICRRLATATALAIAISLGATWLGILLAYDSFDWWPSHRSLPASSLVVGLIVLAYAASGLLARRRSA